MDGFLLAQGARAPLGWHDRRTGGYSVQTRDHIAIIESAYALDAPDVQWQYRLTDLVAEQWSGTAASFLYDASEAGQLTCERLVVRVAGERSVVDAPRAIPLENAALRQCLFATRPHLVQLGDLLGPELRESEECRGVLDVARDLRPGPFSVILRTLDVNQRGLFFVLPPRPVGDRMRVMWGEVAVHVGLAYRLRCALMRTEGDGLGTADPRVLRRALRQAAHNVLRDTSILSPPGSTRGPSGAG